MTRTVCALDGRVIDLSWRLAEYGPESGMLTPNAADYLRRACGGSADRMHAALEGAFSLAVADGALRVSAKHVERALLALPADAGSRAVVPAGPESAPPPRPDLLGAGPGRPASDRAAAHGFAPRARHVLASVAVAAALITGASVPRSTAPLPPPDADRPQTAPAPRAAEFAMQAAPDPAPASAPEPAPVAAAPPISVARVETAPPPTPSAAAPSVATRTPPAARLPNATLPNVTLPDAMPTRVVIEYPRGDAGLRAEAGKLADALPDRSVAVVPVAGRDAPRAARVGYRFAEDRPAAERLASALGAPWQARPDPPGAQAPLAEPGTIRLSLP